MTKRIKFNGKTQPLSAWAKECNLSVVLLRWRLANDWPVKDALTKPAQARMLNLDAMIRRDQRKLKRLASQAEQIASERRTTWDRLMANVYTLQRRGQDEADQAIAETAANLDKLMSFGLPQVTGSNSDRGDGVNFREKPSDRSSSVAQETT